jgi:hypothetical protein
MCCCPQWQLWSHISGNLMKHNCQSLKSYLWFSSKWFSDCNFSYYRYTIGYLFKLLSLIYCVWQCVCDCVTWPSDHQTGLAVGWPTSSFRQQRHWAVYQRWPLPPNRHTDGLHDNMGRVGSTSPLGILEWSFSNAECCDLVSSTLCNGYFVIIFVWIFF